MSANDQSVFERNADKIGKGVGVVCVLLLVADVVYHVVGHKHVHFDFEAIPGFYALAGFISYVGLVLTAKKLRTWLRRDENYYGEAPLVEEHDLHEEPAHEHDAAHDAEEEE